jgi:hypothetical protein
MIDYIWLAVFFLGGLLLLSWVSQWTEQAEAMRVAPTACYSTQTMGAGEHKRVWALVFNQCNPSFQWIAIPPLGSES